MESQPCFDDYGSHLNTCTQDTEKCPALHLFDIKESLKKHPDSPYLNYLLSCHYEKTGLYTKAIDSARRCVKYAPKQIMYFQHLFDLYIRTNQLVEARCLIDKELHAFPAGQLVSFLYEIQLLARERKYIEYFKMVNEHYPEPSDTLPGGQYFIYLDMKATAGDRTGALKLATEYLESQCVSPLIYQYICWLYLLDGNDVEAMKYGKLFIEKNPGANIDTEILIYVLTYLQQEGVESPDKPIAIIKKMDERSYPFKVAQNFCFTLDRLIEYFSASEISRNKQLTEKKVEKILTALKNLRSTIDETFIQPLHWPL